MRIKQILSLGLSLIMTVLTLNVVFAAEQVNPIPPAVTYPYLSEDLLITKDGDMYYLDGSDGTYTKEELIIPNINGYYNGYFTTTEGKICEIINGEIKDFGLSDVVKPCFRDVMAMADYVSTDGNVKDLGQPYSYRWGDGNVADLSHSGTDLLIKYTDGRIVYKYYYQVPVEHQWGIGYESREYDALISDSINAKTIIDIRLYEFILSEEGTLYLSIVPSDYEDAMKNPSALEPKPIMENVKKVVSSATLFSDPVYVLKDDGTVWFIGENWFGEGNTEPIDDKYSIIPITGIENVTDISSRVGYAYAVKKDGSVWYWGGSDPKHEPENFLITPTRFDGLNAFGEAAKPDVPENLGDVDDDGIITSNDAALANIIADGGEHINAARADVDGDGAVTAADGAEIMKKVLRASYEFKYKN